MDQIEDCKKVDEAPASLETSNSMDSGLTQSLETSSDSMDALLSQKSCNNESATAPGIEN